MRIAVPATLDAARASRLADAIESARDVIVLEGDADAFCRGMDLAALIASCDDRAIADGVAAFARCVRAILTAKRPVIAAVDGAALGGGVGIAAAADVVLATSRATFGLPEALFGLVPGVVLPVLLQRVRPHHARMLALTGHARTAIEAERIGLVDAVVTDLDAAVRGAVRQMSRPRPGAVRVLKRLDAELDAQIERGAADTSRLLRSPDVVASIRRFVDGEEMPWQFE